jgi:hypothetical protein
MAAASSQREEAAADFFVPNKYKRWYDQLMLKSNTFGDQHHILPRCLGGSDDPQNLVRLTYRQHFLAHWLLTKFTKGKAKMKCLNALHRMKDGRRGTSWQYEVSRKSRIGLQVTLGRYHSDETKRKLRRKYHERRGIRKTTIVNALLGFGG